MNARDRARLDEGRSEIQLMIDGGGTMVRDNRRGVGDVIVEPHTRPPISLGQATASFGVSVRAFRNKCRGRREFTIVVLVDDLAYAADRP
jgi:hypothetical protein